MADDPTLEEAPDEYQDQPDEVEAPEASDKADQPDTPEYFSETFDPATLPDELRPAYQQLRADYTRKTQTVAEQRKEIEQEQQLLQALRSDDPQLRAQAFDALGLELVDEDVDEEEDGEYEDPYASRLDRLEQALDAQAQSAHQQQLEAAINEDVDGQIAQLQTATGREFSPKELNILEKVAFSTPGQDGMPDIRGAYEEIYGDVLAAERTRWVRSKQAPQPGQGQGGSPAVDMSNTQARRAALARAIEEASDD